MKFKFFTNPGIIDFFYYFILPSVDSFPPTTKNRGEMFLKHPIYRSFFLFLYLDSMKVLESEKNTYCKLLMYSD